MNFHFKDGLEVEFTDYESEIVKEGAIRLNDAYHINNNVTN